MMTQYVLLPLMPTMLMPVSWALVGAALVWWLWPRAPHAPSARAMSTEADSPCLSRTQRAVKGSGWLAGLVAVVVAVGAVWPQGGWSGYAALALQSPSLLSVVWALTLLLQVVGGLKLSRENEHAASVPAVAWLLLCALGWGLVIDTLNLWPRGWEVSVYAWGFTAGSLWLSAGLVLALAWRHTGHWVWSAIAVLAVYAVLRWPSGNVWDAWLDPGVWIVAHVQVVRHLWHGVVHRTRR